MRYKLFISTSDSPTCLVYLGAVKSALWDINEMTISSVSALDVAQDVRERMVIAKQIMETTQLFIGVYGAEYGTVPEPHALSYAEQELRLAQQRGILCAVFVANEAKQTTDERMKRFLAHLSQTLVINYFSDTQDLMAQVIMAVDKFYKAYRDMRFKPASEQPLLEALLPTAPPQSVTVQRASFFAPPDEFLAKGIEAEEIDFRSPEPTLAEPDLEPKENLPIDIGALVEDALRVASDDIEMIVRRALQVHEAQKRITVDQTNDGWLRVSPIFGEPLRQTQFQSDLFMIMPFRDQFNSIYHNVIRPVTTSLNLTIKRGDDFSSVRGSIMQEVWSALNACRLVIAETTEVNANVYYELGIAHTLGKSAILLTQNKDIEQIPFDIRHLRFIVYENTIQGGEKLAQDLKQAIIWILNDLKEQGDTPS